jgi:hypothetical protein
MQGESCSRLPDRERSFESEAAEGVNLCSILSNSLTVTIGSKPSVMVNVSIGTSRTMKIFRAHDAARYFAILAVVGGYVLEHKTPLAVARP